MKGRTPSIFILIFLLTGGGVSCLAQAREIRGIVTDPSGAVVVGAVVQLWAGNQVIATTKTDGKGSYVVQFEHEQIPHGLVRLSVTAEGFAAADRKIELAQAVHLVIPVRLEIAALSEQIHVEAKSRPFQDQLDLNEVRESPARDVGEALTEVDGVYKIRRGGIANDVLVRGFQQGNINVLIDGARVYSACPDHMDPAAYHADFAEVERVEVSKGAFDVTSEGSLGAAIRVVTKTPPLGLRITPSISFGSFGYYNPSVTASFGNDAFRLLAGYSYRVSGPYKDGSGRSFLDYANYNMAVRNLPAFDINTGWVEIEFMPTENQKLSLAYTRQQSGRTLLPYLMMDTGYDNADRASLKYEISNLAGAVHAIRAQSYFTQVIHFMSDHYRTSAAMAIGDPWMMAADARSRAIGGHLEADAGRDLTLGFEGYSRNWNMMGYMDMGMPPVWVEPTVPNVGTNELGAFADYHHAFSDRLKLTGGVRFDHNSMASGDRNLDNYLLSYEAGYQDYLNQIYLYQNTHSTSTKDNYGSGNVRLSFALPHSVELFAGVGTAGRVPNAQERYINSAYMMTGFLGNPDLPVVRNTETTLGATFRHGSSYIKPTLFYSNVNNYILVNNQPLQNSGANWWGPGVRSYTNVEARIYGGEVSYAFSLPVGFSLTGGGSYARGANAPKPQAGVLDTNLPEMPPLRTSVALRYTHRFGFAELGGTGVARQGLVDTDLKETPTAGYGLMNVKLGVSYSKLSASFVVENLFNHYYYEHLSYYRDPFASGVKIPEPGRNFFGQVKVSF
jgi:iron complex outermembrane receptor protein